MRKHRVAFVCIAALAVSTPEADAQGQGVTVDPDSPSGKEYAIPLDSARRQANPGAPARSGVPAGSTALFGEGVVTSSGSRGQTQAPSGAQQGAGTGGGGAAGSGRKNDSRGSAPAVVAAAASRPATPDGGIGMPILVLGAGLLVVLSGVAAGVVIRRRSEE